MGQFDHIVAALEASPVTAAFRKMIEADDFSRLDKNTAKRHHLPVAVPAPGLRVRAQGQGLPPSDGDKEPQSADKGRSPNGRVAAPAVRRDEDGKIRTVPAGHDLGDPPRAAAPGRPRSALSTALTHAIDKVPMLIEFDWTLLRAPGGFATSDRGYAIHDPTPPFPWASQAILSSENIETTVPPTDTACLLMRRC